MHVQATADTHTVARMWRYLRDGRFLGSHSNQVTLRLALHSSEARMTTFWTLVIRPLPSGRIQARAALSPVPCGPQWPLPRITTGILSHVLLSAQYLLSMVFS